VRASVTFSADGTGRTPVNLIVRAAVDRETHLRNISSASADLEREELARRPMSREAEWPLVDLAWFVWIPLAGALIGLVVGLLMGSVILIVASPIAGVVAFLMWHVIRGQSESEW
jgi:hypothetical protein